MPYYNFDVNIQNIADDFYLAYKRCIEGKNPHVDEYGRHVMEVVNVPALVNAAFACELYLKMLIKDDTTRGHNLEILFSQLEVDDKDRIRNIVTERLKKGSLEKGFDYYLKGISNDFEFFWCTFCVSLLCKENEKVSRRRDLSPKWCPFRFFFRCKKNLKS